MYGRYIVASVLLIVSSLLGFETKPVIENRALLSFTDAHARSVRICDICTIYLKKSKEESQIRFFHRDRSGTRHFFIRNTRYTLSPTDRFYPGEEIFVRYLPPSAKSTSHAPAKRITLRVETSDHDFEKIMCAKASDGSFFAIIKSSTDPSDKRGDNGYLYVRPQGWIRARPIVQRRTRSPLIAQARVLSSPAPRSDSDRGYAVWLSTAKRAFIMEVGAVREELLTLSYKDSAVLTDATLSLVLSSGIRIVPGSCTLQQRPIEPGFDPNTRTYRFSLSGARMQSGSKLSCLIEPGLHPAREQYIKTRVYRASRPISNPLRQKVTIAYDDTVHPRSGIVAGRVKGVSPGDAKHIVLYLSDGAFSGTDDRGRYHFDRVMPGTHVVQIDKETIPSGYVLTECRQNVTAAGALDSRFVTVAPGMMQQVDFCLKKSAKKRKRGPHMPRKSSSSHSSAPRFSVADLSGFSKEEYRWLWPSKEGYVPSIGSVKVAIVHPKREKMKLFLNGSEVDPLNYEGALSSAKYASVIERYRGIDIREGDNLLEAEIYDASGKKVRTLSRLVHFSGAPYRVRLLEKSSFLVADGRHAPTIALRLEDRYGYPVRASMQGRCFVEPPYRLFRERKEGTVERENRYTVENNGTVYIRLEPTTLASDVKLHFDLQKGDEIVTVPLRPQMRKWILVGFAEGTTEYETLKRFMKPMQRSEKLRSRGRVAFFAKGTISGDTLLTMAYDSGKRRDLSLFEQIDPRRTYTIYQDDSFQGHEAPSRRKLYLKIENSTFKILFGDMKTGLNTVELARYQRSLNGLKMRYRDHGVQIDAFASDDATRAVRDEIKPDGTGGGYALSHKRIVENSQKVYIVVRDRNRPQKVLGRRLLAPDDDYEIFEDEGLLYLKKPLFRLTPEGNLNVIEVEYEIAAAGRGSMVAGGRAVLESSDRTGQVGATLIHEPDASLAAFDARLELGKRITLRAEAARTKKRDKLSSTAYYLEAEHHNRHSSTRAYLRLQKGEFGLEGQQSRFDADALRYGIEGSYSYRNNWMLKILMQQERSLAKGGVESLLEVKNAYRKENLEGFVGYRLYRERDGAGGVLLGGYTRRLMNNRLRLQFGQEYLLHGPESRKYTPRSSLGASYSLSKTTTLYLRGELSGKSEKRTGLIAGIENTPWNRARIKSSFRSLWHNDTQTLFGDYQFVQGYQASKHLYLDGGIEKSARLKGEGRNPEGYTSYYGAFDYRRKHWNAGSRISFRKGEHDRLNIDLNCYGEDPGLNLGMVFGIRSEYRYGDKGTRHIRASVATAYRPGNATMLLQRFIYDTRTQAEERSKQYGNALLFSVRPTKNIELITHYAIKFSRTQIKNRRYDRLTDLLGWDLAYDLNTRTRVGVEATLLHNWKTKALAYSGGVYTGYNLFKNGWFTLGYRYNTSEELQSDPRSKTAGIYLDLRMKFDHTQLEDAAKYYGLGAGHLPQLHQKGTDPKKTP